MGLSIKVFIVEDDDTIKRLPRTQYERLLKRSPDERLLNYGSINNNKAANYQLI